MKSALRVLALLVVFASAAVATVSPRSAQVLPSHQTASAAMPMPVCPSCQTPTTSSR